MELIYHEDVVNLGDKPYEFKEFYQIEPFLKDQISLSNFHSAIAKFGGPLALHINRNVLMSSIDDKSIANDVCFFSSEGIKINSVRFDSKDEIICFEFLQCELLFILTKKHEFYLIDPYIQVKKAKPFSFDSSIKGNIISARVFRNSCAVCTKSINPNQAAQAEEYNFYCIQNIHNLKSDFQNEVKCESFAKSRLKEAPRDWIVIPSEDSVLNELELQIAHPDAGIISLTQSTSQLYYTTPEVASKQSTQKTSSRLASIKSISCISMSPNTSLIAYLLDEGNSKIKLCVVSNDYEGTVFSSSEVDLKEFQLPSQQQIQKSIKQKMVWCGDHCCILQGEKSILMIGPKVSEDIKLQEDYVLSTEVDGLRILTRRSNKMLRLLPMSYLNTFPNIFLKYSEEIKPCAQLLQNYQNMRKDLPFDDSELRGNTIQLKQAITECLASAEFTSEEEKSQDLVQAVSYGKTYIGADSNFNSEYGKLCLRLRVIKNFKQESISRMMTVAQLNYLLSEDMQSHLISLMLRYDYHSLAINVYNQLDFDQAIKTQIFDHWALRVIEYSSQKFKEEIENSQSSQNESIFLLGNEDERIAQKIVKKLRTESNVQFINIAKKAMKEGRQKLANLLLEQEPSAFKRVPVLIWIAKNCLEFETLKQKMTNSDKQELNKKLKSEEWLQEVNRKQKEYFLRALESALKSRESELLYICLKELDENITNQQLKFDIVKNKVVFSNHYKNYLKNSLDSKKQTRYLEFLKELDSSSSNDPTSSKNDAWLEKGLYLLERGLRTNKNMSIFNSLKSKKENLEMAVESLEKNNEDKFYIEMVKSELNILKRQLDLDQKELNKLNLKEMADWSINKSIMASLNSKDELKAKIQIFNFPSKMVEFLKVRVQIQEKSYDALELYLIDLNKKQVIIQYEVIASILINQGARENAVRLALLIPDMEQRVTILLKLDEPKKAAKSVIESKKNFEFLQMIKDSSKDQGVSNFIDQQLAQRGK